jgi:hypothetical protein
MGPGLNLVLHAPSSSSITTWLRLIVTVVLQAILVIFLTRLLAALLHYIGQPR